MSPMTGAAGQLGWRTPTYVSTAMMPLMAATARMFPASILVTIVILPPNLAAVAVFRVPTITLQNPPIPAPVLAATAAMPAPVVRTDEPVVSAVMAATAQFMAPTISSSIALGVPLLGATAAMPAPAVVIGTGINVAAAIMAATANMLAPSVVAGVGIGVPAVVMAAAATMLTPGISVSPAPIAAPLLAATAAMPNPALLVGIGKTVAAPVLAATAAMLTPTVTVSVPLGFDAVGSSTGSYVSPASFSHIVGTAGAYGLVLISGQSNLSPTTVTFGSTNLTQLGTAPDGSGYQIWLYGASGLAAGTQTVTATTGVHINFTVNSISVKGATSAAVPVTKVIAGPGGHAVSCTANQFIVQGFEDQTYASLNGLTGGTLRWTDQAQPNAAMSISTATSTTTFSTTDTSPYMASIAVVLS